MSKPETPHESVTVAIPTFRREGHLPVLLEEVARQCEEIPNSVDIVVIDNDPGMSAAETVQALPETIAVRYLHEPTPGISAVRDTAVRTARRSRLLVFIDDDELPSDGWLRHLVTHWESCRSAAVAGPQEFILPERIPDPWVIASGVFDSVRHTTGSHRKGASSANLLLDLNFLRDHNLGFDRSLGLRGGEDTMLTHRITAAGGVIEWCDEAVVTEAVVSERISRDWLRRRAFRSGASWGRALIATSRGARGRTISRGAIAFGSSARILLGAGVVVYGLVRRDQRRVAMQKRRIYSLAGALSSVIGAPQIEDYARG